MFHRRRLHTFVIALLLATLPWMGLASFARDAQSAWAMQMQAQASTAPSAMSEHCKAMAHAAKAACKSGAHCSMCDGLSVSLAVNETPLLDHRLAAAASSEPADFLLNATLASLWRPPRLL